MLAASQLTSTSTSPLKTYQFDQKKIKCESAPKKKIKSQNIQHLNRKKKKN